MNKYIDLNRIEFAITNACTGRCKQGINVNEGNNISPSGNALKYLGDYFSSPDKIDLTVHCGSIPYTTKLDDIKCLGIDSNGDVNLCSITIGNIYKNDIADIVDRYDPYKHPDSQAILNGGVSELLRHAESQNITVNTSDCRSACGVCRKIMTALKEKERTL